MATAPTTGTNTPGHESFNDQENTLPRDPSGHPLPSPGAQPTGTSPLTGTGIPTGTRPPGWMTIFMRLLAAYVANPNTQGVPISDEIFVMLELLTDRLCARYPKEISVASF